jgi:hypothetical protein
VRRKFDGSLGRSLIDLLATIETLEASNEHSTIRQRLAAKIAKLPENECRSRSSTP